MIIITAGFYLGGADCTQTPDCTECETMSWGINLIQLNEF